MSIYTVELRHLLAQGYQLNLNNYPIFDESYRATLNANIINWFMFREIGFETADRFNWELGAKMAVIMPYYNLLYKAVKEDFDPLTNHFRNLTVGELVNNVKNGTINITTEDTANMERTSKSTGSGTSTSHAETENSKSGNSDDIFSDTPSAPLPADLSPGYYTTRRKISTSENDTGTADGSTTSSTTANGEDSETTNKNGKSDKTSNEKEDINRNRTEIEKGYEAVTVGEMLKSFRDGLYNVDMMIIEELETLFMGVYYCE